ERAEHAPVEHAVLALERNREVAEHGRDHEDVVERERLLDQERVQELERRLPAVELVPDLQPDPEPVVGVREVDEAVEQDARAAPHERPEQRLAGGLRAMLAMEHAEIECESREQQYEQTDPEGRDHRRWLPRTTSDSAPLANAAEGAAPLG